MWYVLPESNKQYPVTIERVRKIRTLNLQGVIPDELEVVDVTTNKPKEIEPEFVDVVGQISLRTLDKKERQKKQQGPQQRGGRDQQREQRGPQQQGPRPPQNGQGQQGGPQQRPPQQGGGQRPQQGGPQQRPNQRPQQPQQRRGPQQGGPQQRPPQQGGQQRPPQPGAPNNDSKS